MNKKLFNTQVEALTMEHGAEIVKFYKSQGFDTYDYKGTVYKGGSNPARYYGVDNDGQFRNRGSDVLTNHTLEQLKEMVNETKTTKNEVLVGKLKTAYEEVSCSEIKARIQTYLERNWRGFDDQYLRIKTEDIDELYARASNTDIEVLERIGIRNVVKHPVEGTPFLVRDSATRWWLAYADGNGKYVGLDGIGSVPYAYSHELKISKDLLPK